MSAANPNPMENSMVSVLVVANAGGGSPLPCGVAAISGIWVIGMMITICYMIIRNYDGLREFGIYRKGGSGGVFGGAFGRAFGGAFGEAPVDVRQEG
jgi:hypothetical protein